jgi:hypothetical protein
MLTGIHTIVIIILDRSFFGLRCCLLGILNILNELSIVTNLKDNITKNNLDTVVR